MKYNTYLLCALFFASCTSETKVHPGIYRAELSINDAIDLPFLMNINVQEENYSAIIINGEEKIEINDVERKGDSLIFRLPVFPSIIKTKITDRILVGKWHNYNKENYAIPFKATYNVSNRFDQKAEGVKVKYVMGKYDVTFKDDEKEWKAIGQFTQNKQGLVRGTFLTKTGDYRYLSGIMDGDQLKLSTFDGAHAFFFSAKLDGNELVDGKFYSGNHYQANWFGTKTEEVSLKNPEEITYLKNKNQPLQFTFSDLNGNEISYPSERFNNKAVIIQILGSWCPNCMDEARYFTELYNEYNDNGLEIIGVAFEKEEDQKKIAANIDRFKESLNVPYPIVYGGLARKDIASEAFPQLNKIMSFPTSIFIDRQGNVRKIHSGFNGPGTGKVYKDFIKDNEVFVAKLIHNKR